MVLDDCMTVRWSVNHCDHHKFGEDKLARALLTAKTMCSLKTEYRDQNLKYNVKTSEVAKLINISFGY
jgi:hypothetical protein